MLAETDGTSDIRVADGDVRAPSGVPLLPGRKTLILVEELYPKIVTFAFVDQEAMFASIIAIGMFVVLPIIGLLLSHQRKMAELIHKSPSSHTEARFLDMQAQLNELRARSADQALALDDCQRMLGQSREDVPPRRVQI